MSDESKIVSLFNVVKNNADDHDLAVKESVKQAFEKAQENDLKDVIITGWTDDGNLILSMAMDSAADIVFTLELVKKEVLDAARLQD